MFILFYSPKLVPLQGVLISKVIEYLRSTLQLEIHKFCMLMNFVFCYSTTSSLVSCRRGISRKCCLPAFFCLKFSQVINLRSIDLNVNWLLSRPMIITLQKILDFNLINFHFALKKWFKRNQSLCLQWMIRVIRRSITTPKIITLWPTNITKN